MKETGIIFSAPMVRAIQDGRKTMTRRIVKPQPENGHGVLPDAYGGFYCIRNRAVTHFPVKVRDVPCPYGTVGDRLWVRETWQPTGISQSLGTQIHYKADGHAKWHAGHHISTLPYKWRSPIHMPRWASRIDLVVTRVRVERLQAITEEDARAEGAHREGSGSAGPYGSGPRWSMESPHPIAVDQERGYQRCLGSARMAFANAWDKINGAGSWEANPFVWVIGFKRVEGGAS